MTPDEHRRHIGLVRELNETKRLLRDCDMSYTTLKLFKDDEVQKLLERIVKLGEERLKCEQRIHILENELIKLRNSHNDDDE